jgi:hypothetical protein
MPVCLREGIFKVLRMKAFYEFKCSALIVSTKYKNGICDSNALPSYWGVQRALCQMQDV